MVNSNAQTTEERNMTKIQLVERALNELSREGIGHLEVLGYIARIGSLVTAVRVGPSTYNIYTDGKLDTAQNSDLASELFKTATLKADSVDELELVTEVQEKLF